MEQSYMRCGDFAYYVWRIAMYLEIVGYFECINSCVVPLNRLVWNGVL